MTYADGTQDVGLWHREKLIKMCSKVSEAFSMVDHEQFDFVPNEQPVIIHTPRMENQKHVIAPIINPPDLYNYEPEVDLGERPNSVFSETLHIGSVAMDLKLFDKEFFKAEHETEADAQNNNSEKQTDAEADFQHQAWNLTPSIISMQRHILKHRRAQSSVSFDCEAILKCNRDGFGESGRLEQLSEELIEACALGDLKRVIDLLDNTPVQVDVSDRTGYTPLLAAAVCIPYEHIHYI